MLPLPVTTTFEPFLKYCITVSALFPKTEQLTQLVWSLAVLTPKENEAIEDPLTVLSSGSLPRFPAAVMLSMMALKRNKR